MTLWNAELFSVTDVNNANYTLNQSNCMKIYIKWHQRICEIILMENSQKLFSWKKSVYLGTVKIAILSPKCHIGNIFTEI